MVVGRQDSNGLGYYIIKDDAIYLNVKVTPNSSKDRILGVLVDGFLSSLKIAISVPAQEGKANLALKKYLSKIFRISISSIDITKGELSSKKLIKVFSSPEDQKRIIQKIKEELENL